MANFTNQLTGSPQERSRTGITPFFVTEELPAAFAATAGNTALLYPLPISDEGTLLSRFELAATDMDTGAVPALTFRFGVGDEDGVIGDAILGASTIGQSGGESTGSINVPIDVTPDASPSASPKYLILEVNAAAATAAAGTITLYGEMACGVNKKLVIGSE